MHTIKNTALISTTPARILEALTTKDGIRGWWTTDVDCDSDKREAAFRFEKQVGVMAVTFRLDQAESRVAMTCIRETNNADCLGTELVFGLRADGNATRVDLVHSGYPAKNEVYDMCTKGWFFLDSQALYRDRQGRAARAAVAGRVIAECDAVDAAVSRRGNPLGRTRGRGAR